MAKGKTKKQALMLVRVGSDLRPATDDYLKDVEAKLNAIVSSDVAVLVTHHAVEIDVYNYLG